MSQGSDVADADGPEFTVFNPAGTLGAVTDRNGTVVGLHIDDDELRRGSKQLAARVVAIAQLAREKSMVGLHDEMIDDGASPETVRELGFPDQEDYRAAEAAKFDTDFADD